jgi:hypothetical protein
VIADATEWCADDVEEVNITTPDVLSTFCEFEAMVLDEESYGQSM